MDDAYKLEKLRSRLAQRGNLRALRSTYRAIFPSFTNLNTPAMWDFLNTVNKKPLMKDSMEWDKLNTTLKYIFKNRTCRTKVLNIGFGSANLEKLVFSKIKRNFEWFGIDISNKSVKQAKRAFPSYHFRTGDVRKINYSDGLFDVVTSLEVLEHLSPKDTFKCLVEIRRVLKSEGKVIISVPLNENLKQMIKTGTNPSAHVRMYTPELIFAELELAGFRVVYYKLFTAFLRHYRIKSLFLTIAPWLKKPNNLLIVATKK